MVHEIWKDIIGYEGLYQISNLGRVKSFLKSPNMKAKDFVINNEKIIKSSSICRGYVSCTLVKNGKKKSGRIHRLVANAFIPNLENKPEVNHIDGVKNNNNVDNLEWVTTSENIHHAYTTLKRKCRDASKSTIKISLDGFIQGVYKSRREAAKENNIDVQGIVKCISVKYKKSGGFIWA